MREDGSIVLATPRLVLRELRAEDRDALHRVLGDPEAMRFYPSPFRPDETERWIEGNQASYRANGYGLWALVLVASGEVIGDCGLTNQEVEGEWFIEVGWHVRRDLWGQGLATEAAMGCRDYGFDELGRDSLISLVRPENRPSSRVAQKIGMSVWKTVHRGPQQWLHHVYRLEREQARAGR